MRIVDVLDRLCAALSSSKTVLYLDNNDDRRRMVLEKLSEFLRHTGENVKFIDMTLLLQDFFRNFDIDKLQNQLMEIVKYDVVIIDNFDIALFIKGLRIALEASVEAFLEQSRGSVVLATAGLAMDDPDLKSFLKKIEPYVIVRYEEQEGVRENKIVAAIKMFVKKFVGNLEGEVVTLV